MTAPIATRRRPLSWRVALILVALLYLVAQASLVAHQVEHLLHGDEATCELCAFGGATALPPVGPSLTETLTRVSPETRDPLQLQPVTRQPRFHLPRAPPA